MGLERRSANCSTNILLFSLLAFPILCLLPIGNTIHEEMTKPFEVCPSCANRAVNGPLIMICYCEPYNRTCPRSRQEWSRNTRCTVRPGVEALAGYLR